MKKKTLGRAPAYLFLIIIFVITVYPLVYTICASFKTNHEIMTANSQLLPKQFTFENYFIAWHSEDFYVPVLLKNSIIYSVCVVLFQLASAAMGGYVFAKGHFSGKKIVFAIMTALMFVNLGGATTVPVLKIVNALHLGGTIWGLLITKMFGINITGIYLIMGYIQTLPKELDEAATIDGCGFFKVFTAITLPLLQPVLITIGILAFQGSWNETLMPTIFTMSRPEQRTLTAGLYALKNVGESASQWNLMMAGSVISMLPVLVVYMFANKHFVTGIASGAVKG